MTVLLIQFNSFIPVYFIDLVSIPLVLVVVLGVAYKFRSWVKIVPSPFFRDVKQHLKSVGIVRAGLSEFVERILAQKDILNDSKFRRVTHMIVFWGFLGLAFATIWDDVFFHDGTLPVPFSFSNFGNIVGNVGGGLLFIGISLIVARYAFVERFAKNRSSGSGDFLFLTLLYVATITGFITEFSRLSGVVWFAYYDYAIHLGFVFALIVTAPFTHFFHALLTPFMRYIGRLQEQLVGKGVSKYPYERKQEMARLAIQLKDGKEKPTFPDWLGIRNTDHDNRNNGNKIADEKMKSESQ